MVQKRETKAINKLCVREIISLSFVCGAYFFEFRGWNLVCFVIAYNGSREDTHAHCVFHACRLCPPFPIFQWEKPWKRGWVSRNILMSLMESWRIVFLR